MTPGLLDLIESEVQEVDSLIKKSFRIKPTSLKEFAHIEEDCFSRNFHPAVILLSGRMLGITGQKIIALAAVIEFIYLAALVHFRVPDVSPDPAITKPRDGAQYPVLVGDYLYGRFFTTLCDGGIVPLLKPLAQIICEMNAGGILRTQGYDTPEEKYAVIEKESAALLRDGCGLVGTLVSQSDCPLDSLKNLGYNIGMGYGLLERGFTSSEAGEYINRGLEILEKDFPDSEAKRTLQSLLKGVMSGEIPVPEKKYGATSEEMGETMDKKADGLEIPDKYKNKEEYVHDIFSKIAGRYDFLNTVLSLNRDKYWRKFTVEKTGLKPGGMALDVCCGTGMISMELAKAVGSKGKVVGLDFCGDMLEIGKENIKNTPFEKNIEFVQGNAMELPFPDNTFDSATIGFGLRNVPEMRKAIQEMMRVVKPGGKVVSLEFAKPTVQGFKQIYNFYFDKWVPFLGKLGVGIDGPYRYLHKSWTIFPHQKEVREIFSQIGLNDAEFFELTGGVVAVHVGTKPEADGYVSVAATTEPEYTN